MGLTFSEVDRILKSFGLLPHEIKDGQCVEYSFKNKVLNIKKKNVATRVSALKNGGVGGYIYIDHLKDYENHPQKTKMGHIPIGNMTEEELKNTIEKVIKEYK